MKKQKSDIIERLCGLMVDGAVYPLKSLKTLCESNGISSKSLANSLRSESKKTRPNILVRGVSGKQEAYYTLNPGISFIAERELAERNSVEGIARAIDTMNNVKNRKAIEQWICSEFEKKMDQSVQKFVAQEFQNEILPVLIQHIDNKLESVKSISKNQVKEIITEVFSDMISRLT